MKSYVFPGDIDQDIMKIGAKPFLYMRTDEFSQINKDSERMLLDLIHCTEGRTIIYTGSGTGAMSAVVENYVVTKKKSIVIDGGSFGHRWFEMCEYYGVPTVRFQVPFGKDLDYALFEKTIAEERPEVLLCQHHETSSGMLFNISKISQICHRYNVSIVLDAISSFLAEELSMDKYGIDICITSSQKGLNIPPGLSIIFLSKMLQGYEFAHKGFYWDFDTNLDNLRRGQTPFSPATILYLQLNRRLHQIMEEGGENANIAMVRHRAEVFRRLCGKYGWKVAAEVPSCAVTSFQTDERTERAVFRGLIDRYDTYIMPSGVPGFYRISHMGLQSDKDLEELAAHIAELSL